MTELMFTFDLLRTPVNFMAVRENIFSLNSFPSVDLLSKKSMIIPIYSDSSLKAWGFFSETPTGTIAMSEIWPEAWKEKYPINILEFTALIIAFIITNLYIVRQSDLKTANCASPSSSITMVMHIDNENAENVCKTRKARVKSKNLARLAKLLNTLSITFRVKSIYTRISSSENSVSDRLSRAGPHSSVNLAFLLGRDLDEFYDNVISNFVLGGKNVRKILSRKEN